MLYERLRRLPAGVVDAGIVLVALATTLVAAGSRGSLAEIMLALLASFVLLERRRSPLLVLATVLAATIGCAFALDTLFPFPLAVAVYSVAANCDRRTAVAAGLASAVLLVGPFLRAADWAGGNVLAALVLLAAAWLLGDSMRTRRAYLGELEARAERLERERDEDARRAAADERARIARELHDVIAHNVSVMVVQAAAGNDIFESRPDRAREALHSIERTGREALAELRRLLGVIRTPADEPLAPQPGLHRLSALAGQVRTAGLPVELRIDGDLGPVPAGIDLSAYRIVQEALTNTLKHAHASSATVTVRRACSSLELDVWDDGSGRVVNGNANGSGGRGLIGMRERVALFGGQVETGNREGGGFAVRAVFPLAEARP